MTDCGIEIYGDVALAGQRLLALLRKTELEVLRLEAASDPTEYREWLQRGTERHRRVAEAYDRMDLPELAKESRAAAARAEQRLALLNAKHAGSAGTDNDQESL